MSEPDLPTGIGIERYSQLQSVEDCVYLYIKDWAAVSEDGLEKHRVGNLANETDYSVEELEYAVSKLKHFGEIYEYPPGVLQVT